MELFSLPLLQGSRLSDLMHKYLVRISQANAKRVHIYKNQLISWIAPVARYLVATMASFPRGTIVIGKQLG